MESNQNIYIIRNYQRFFVFVAKYLFLLLAIVIAGFFFHKIFIGTAWSGSVNDAFILQRTKLIATFEKFLSKTVQDNDLQIYILQWPLLSQNNFLVSQDNLVSYKWFVVPRNFTIDTTVPLQQADYFGHTTYTTGELALFVNNVVLVSQDNASHTIQNTQIPLNGGLISTFNLSCMQENKLYPKTCLYYLNDFLESFFVYHLNADYAGLQKIFDATTQPAYRTRFCDGMKKYLLYTNDTDKQLSPIFDQCGSWYMELYKRMGFFVAIQQQLTDKYISADVYKDQILNAYKLLSYQQILYQDFQELKISKNEYTLYLDYVQELIKRHGLSQFYLDELYRYNTYYLKPTLLTTRYDRRRASIKENEIMQVVKTIDTINIGDMLSNASGLILLVSNPSLVQSSTAPPPATVLSMQDQIAKKIAAISYFTVSQSTINNDTVEAQGYFIVNNQKIASKIQMIYRNDSFVIKQVELTNYAELSTVLQWLIKTRDTTLGEFFVALSKNLPLYTTTSTPIIDLSNLCTQIRQLESWLAMQVSTCTQDVIVISKMINGASVTYSFLLQNYLPTNITVSDTNLQKAVENAVKQDNYNPKSLAESIQFVLSVKSDAPVVHAGSTNTLLTLDDFQNFLGITANDIAEKNAVILVDFTVQWVDFIASYDVTKHTIVALYFKDIISGGQPLPIKTFSLILDDTNQIIIDSFTQDPLSYIKAIDLTAWKNYSNKK